MPQEVENRGYEAGIKIKNLLKEYGIGEDLLLRANNDYKKAYDYRDEKKVEYYEFVINYTLIFDRFDLIDTFRRDCISAGATKFEIVQLNNTKLSQHQIQATKLAYQNAKKNAETIAKISGLQLGKPVWISSDNSFYVEDYSDSYTEGLGKVTPKSVREPLFQQRKIRLTDSVSVKFTIN